MLAVLPNQRMSATGRSFGISHRLILLESSNSTGRWRSRRAAVDASPLRISNRISLLRCFHSPTFRRLAAAAMQCC